MYKKLHPSDYVRAVKLLEKIVDPKSIFPAWAKDFDPSGIQIECPWCGEYAFSALDIQHSENCTMLAAIKLLEKLK